MRGVIRWFRRLALVETVSYLALLTASIGAHVFGDVVLVDVMGPVHGSFFLCYLGLARAIRRRVGWSWRTVAAVAVAAAVPLGARTAERRLLPADAGAEARDGRGAAPIREPVAEVG